MKISLEKIQDALLEGTDPYKALGLVAGLLYKTRQTDKIPGLMEKFEKAETPGECLDVFDEYINLADLKEDDEEIEEGDEGQ